MKSLNELRALIICLLPLAVPMWLADNMAVGAGIGVLFYILAFFLFRKWLQTPAGQKWKAKQEAETAELASLCDFDAKNGVLTLHKRSPKLAQLIQLIESKDVFTKYKPETLHVGAVTVGGVTSGGTYTTGGYNVIAAEKKNGLCTLNYGEEAIRRIKLDDALYVKAAQSELKEFLDADTRSIIVITEQRLSEMERQLALQSLKETGYVGNKAAHAGYPTIEKAELILQWITTEEA